MARRRETRKEIAKEMAKALEYRHPSLYTDYWAAFVGWLIDYRGFTGDDITYVMQKPWKYEPESKELVKESDWFMDLEDDD